MTNAKRNIAACCLVILAAAVAALAGQTAATTNAASNQATPSLVRTNSLGMEFLPVPGTRVWFSRWETRVKDYAVFADQTKVAWPKPPFEQGPTHPAVNVNWSNAQAFCAWLTDRETKQGMLKAGEKYRLPKDTEWSRAVGLRNEKGANPEEKTSGNQNVYPWGTVWPPPVGAGNYGGQEATGSSHIRGYRDDYPWTAPVGSFKPNAYGLYDMGGNALEWCEEGLSERDEDGRVFRGGCWRISETDQMRSAYRCSARFDLDATGGDGGEFGFRCVFDTGVMAPEEPTPVPADPDVASKPPVDVEELLRLEVLAHTNEIIAALKDPNPGTRKEAVEELRELGLKEAIPALGNVAVNDPDADIRCVAVGALATQDCPDVVPYLLKVLKNNETGKNRHDNEGTILSAAETLVNFGQKEVVAMLASLLDSET